MGLRTCANMVLLNTNKYVAPAGRVSTAALPLVRVRFMRPVPQLAPEINARNIPARDHTLGDALSPRFEDRAVPIKRKRQRDPPSERIL